MSAPAASAAPCTKGSPAPRAAAGRTPIRPRLGRTGKDVAMMVVATDSAAAAGSPEARPWRHSEEAEGG